MKNDSVQFFEKQFQSQVAIRDLSLNPFETLALPYLQGRVLDFGCGLGNLAVAAAKQGCTVLAIDAAPTAISHLAALASREQLAIQARQADLQSYVIEGTFDTVASIGLLMFFDCATMRHQLAALKAHLRPGGVAVINVLIEGTTYVDMFDQRGHCLFSRSELQDAFSGWEILLQSFAEFPAPADTRKSFVTLVARKPAD
jgi:tellurite methyltransferase